METKTLQRVKIYGKISSCRQRRKSWLLYVSPLNCQEINKNIEITPLVRARPRQWHWYLGRNLPLYLVQLHQLNNSSHEPNESRKVAKRSLAHQMCCVYIFKLYAGLLISFAEKSAFLSHSRQCFVLSDGYTFLIWSALTAPRFCNLNARYTRNRSGWKKRNG